MASFKYIFFNIIFKTLKNILTNIPKLIDKDTIKNVLAKIIKWSFRIEIKKDKKIYMVGQRIIFRFYRSIL